MEDTKIVTDEINLLDLWKILVKRKRTAIWVFGLVIGLAVAAIFLMPPIYESRAVVLIGKVGGLDNTNQSTSFAIEPASELVRRLTEFYQVKDASEQKIEPPFVNSITLNRKQGENIVELAVHDVTAQGAQAYLQAVLDKLLAEHDQAYNKAYTDQKHHLQMLTDYKASIQSQLQAMNGQIRRLDHKNPAQAAVLAIEAGKFLSLLPEIESQIMNIELTLSDFQSKPTSLLRKPTLPRKAERPRPHLYLALGVVLGMFLGIFAAFLHEFLANARIELTLTTE